MLNTITKTVKNQANKARKPLIFQAFSRLKTLSLSVTFSLASHRVFAQTVIGGGEITTLGNDVIATTLIIVRILFVLGLLALAVTFGLKQKQWGWAGGFGISALIVAVGPETADYIFGDTEGFYVDAN